MNPYNVSLNTRFTNKFLTAHFTFVVQLLGVDGFDVTIEVVLVAKLCIARLAFKLELVFVNHSAVSVQMRAAGILSATYETLEGL